MKLEFSRQIFEKFSNIKFHENPSSGSQVVPCVQTDMTKLIAAFRDFANAPKITKKITFYEQPLRFVRDPKSGVASVASTSKVCTYSILVRLNVGGQ